MEDIKEKLSINDLLNESILFFLIKSIDRKILPNGEDTLIKASYISNPNIKLTYEVKKEFYNDKLYAIINNVFASNNDIHEGYSRLVHNIPANTTLLEADFSTSASPDVKEFITRHYNFLKEKK